MFEVRIDGVEQLLNKVETFSRQIAELHKSVPQELETWQRDDMRRQYPNTKTDSRNEETLATTLIWPRQRAENERRRLRSTGPKQHQPGRTGQGRSNRPILREELKTKLQDRMNKLAAEAMQWP